MTWVVIYNALPLHFEMDGCATKAWELFESKDEAHARYEALRLEDLRYPTVRPYHPSDGRYRSAGRVWRMSKCPGSPADRCETLEAEVAHLTERLESLEERLEALEARLQRTVDE